MEVTVSERDGSQAPEQELIRVRREKRDAIKAAGKNPYPNDFRPTAGAREVADRYADKTREQLEDSTDTLAVAGRLISKRDFGKSSFAHILDGTGKIQVFFQAQALGDTYDETKTYDIGDIVGVVGTPFRTKTNELTVNAAQVRLLTKGLRPLPEKWHGLSDIETRYRRRYVDLIVNPHVKEVFLTRSRLIAAVRAFFIDKGFIEVDTPMLHQIVGGAAARPFVTHHNTLDMDLFLRIAPELYLKRLVVGGMEKVFEINKNFRNEGISTHHNPEFTMLEFYEAYKTYEDLMTLTEELFADVARNVLGKTTLTYQGAEIDLAPPWERIELADAVVKYGGIEKDVIADGARMRSRLKDLGVEPEASWGNGKLLLELFEKTAEDKLTGPVFVTSYPTEVSPLSRPSDDRPGFTDRFEFYIAGMEIANAFSELNDPDDQERRFLAQLEADDFGEGIREYDRDYIRALEYGLAPAAGEGIGIDRMVMIFTDSASIRDVILFPQMRDKE
ncbi:MAG: lysine--tRNA ligase [Deltaproteobacteria bacterium]|nr:lysine--tRNA ligase [Candidatus Zymogenaceae bacterium]